MRSYIRWNYEFYTLGKQGKSGWLRSYIFSDGYAVAFLSLFWRVLTVLWQKILRTHPNVPWGKIWHILLIIFTGLSTKNSKKRKPRYTRQWALEDLQLSSGVNSVKVALFTNMSTHVKKTVHTIRRFHTSSPPPQVTPVVHSTRTGWWVLWELCEFHASIELFPPVTVTFDEIIEEKLAVHCPRH